MLRTFNEHSVRTVQSLDGLWELVTAEQWAQVKKHKGAKRSAILKKVNRPINVPSAWETLPGMEDYRGICWLRRTFYSDGRAVRLVFGGVSHTADVYVDGKHVGHHYDAFTPFECALPNLDEGEHELLVKVDNTFGPHSALHIENDYYTYGGITRPVELQMLDDVYVSRLDAIPVRSGKTWSLELAIELTNLAKAALKRRVVVQLGDYLVDAGQVTIKGKATRVVKKSLTNLDVDAWTVEQPNLYLTEVLLLDEDEVMDDKVDRVGFREIKVQGKKLMLNGESIRLRGYNRHEDHPQFGCAIPVEAMMTDLQLMQDLGCNFIRTSHYPNDMRFLDLCDELGFYVWEETHSRTVDITTEVYKQQITDSATEMVTWHKNHPSIIMWGCLNECENRNASGAAEHGRVLRLMKKLDGSRPVTYASMYDLHDKAYKHADIVSWNRYDNWYGSREVKPCIDHILKWLHSSPKTGGKGKPVIMSEFGAGGIYGWRKSHRDRWTEEYQCDAMNDLLEVYLHHPDICGVAIWQFCDVRLTKEWWKTRPRNMNNKGTVDEYRRPKMVYEVVKKHMHAAAKKYR